MRWKSHTVVLETRNLVSLNAYRLINTGLFRLLIHKTELIIPQVQHILLSYCQLMWAFLGEKEGRKDHPFVPLSLDSNQMSPSIRALLPCNNVSIPVDEGGEYK